jgi:hypothetical protein
MIQKIKLISLLLIICSSTSCAQAARKLYFGNNANLINLSIENDVFQSNDQGVKEFGRPDINNQPPHDSTRKFRISLDLQKGYNTISNPTSAKINFEFNRHSIYFGGSYILITDKYLEKLSDRYQKYNTKYWGIKTGYIFFHKKPVAHSPVLLIQLDFLIYQLNYKQYSLITGNDFSSNKIVVVENTFNVGCHFEILKKVFVEAGVGWGSDRGFFLIIDELFISSFIGLGYSF